METSTNTPSIEPLIGQPINFSNGEILISILLITLILLKIFGSIHNALIGIKTKKPQYD